MLLMDRRRWYMWSELVRADGLHPIQTIAQCDSAT